jgi:hypothetical protein
VDASLFRYVKRKFNLRERDYWEDQDVGGWIILGRILERWDWVMWTGLVWLRIGTGGELLRIRY